MLSSRLTHKQNKLWLPLNRTTDMWLQTRSETSSVYTEQNAIRDDLIGQFITAAFKTLLCKNVVSVHTALLTM